MDLQRPLEYLWADRADEFYDIKIADAERRRDRVSRTKPLFSSLATNYASCGNLALVLDRHAQAVGNYQTSVWYRRWAMELISLAPDECTDVVLPSTTRPITIDRIDDQPGRQWWVESLTMAVALGEWEAVDAALRFDRFSMSEDFGLHAEQSRVELYRTLFQSGPNTPELLITALEATDTQGAAPQVRDYWLGKLVPEYTVIAAILGGDQTSFNDAVLAAHAAHLEWFSVTLESGGQRSGEDAVVINWPITALVRQAVRSGFDEPPASPYFPDFSALL